MDSRNRKYFDYELAYDMYMKVKTLFEQGGFKALKKNFNKIDTSSYGNGYITIYGADSNTWVYLLSKNFDTEKEIDIKDEEQWYVSGEVDIISYGGADDNLYINSAKTLQSRLKEVDMWATMQQYSQDDIENEKESLQKTLAKMV